MESENKYAFAFECACEDPNHILICEVFPEGPNDKAFSAFVYLSGNFRVPWFIRVIFAFLYVFRPNPYRLGNYIRLNERNTEKIINLGKALEEIKAIHAQKDKVS